MNITEANETERNYEGLLSARLLAVASLVLPGLPAADIGTDHAYLAFHLLQHGICPRVIATDKSCGAIEQARRTADHLSGVELRQGDGLHSLKPNDAATIIIAGMGGALICDILSEGAEILPTAQRLVLQPQKNPQSVRSWLMNHSWHIVDEELSFDNGFYYQIIAAEPGNMLLDQDQLDFGPCLLARPHPLLDEYLDSRITVIDHILTELFDKHGKDVAQRLQTLREEREKLIRIRKTRGEIDVR